MNIYTNTYMYIYIYKYNVQINKIKIDPNFPRDTIVRLSRPWTSSLC